MDALILFLQQISGVLPILQQFVNVKAVIAALILTQAYKYLLPSPSPERTTDTIPGHLMTRLTPFVPVIIGAVFCYWAEWDSKQTVEDVFRGMNSGAMAAYINRTVKVSLFGA